MTSESNKYETIEIRDLTIKGVRDKISDYLKENKRQIGIIKMVHPIVDDKGYAVKITYENNLKENKHDEDI